MAAGKEIAKGFGLLAVVLSAVAQGAKLLGKIEQGTVLDASAQAATQAAPIIGNAIDSISALTLTVLGPILALVYPPKAVTNNP